MNSTKRRTSQFLKQYFTFNKSERRGIYLLFSAIVLVSVAPWVYHYFFPPSILPIQHRLLLVDSAEQELFASRPFLADSETINHPAQSRRLFYFDPNTADSAVLLELGFSPRAIKGMLNFRNKGGKFRKADDLFKLYNVDSALVQTLLPYVTLEELESKYSTSTQTYTKPAPQVVDINTADSVALVKLYGIGPRMASKIITYRSEVGGFFSVNQLAEIWGFDPLLIDELKGKITADVSKVRYLFINQVGYEDLKKHPYLRYKQAAALVNYRKQHGPFTSVDDLKKVIIIPDSTCRKLAPYLRFD